MLAADAGTIDLGKDIVSIGVPIAIAVINGIIGLIVKEVCDVIKSKTGFEVDSYHRQAVQTFLENRAGSLIADGAVKIQGNTVAVNNQLLLAAAQEAEILIPDAMKRFGLTPDKIAAYIVDKIPQLSDDIIKEIVTKPTVAPPGASTKA